MRQILHPLTRMVNGIKTKLDKNVLEIPISGASRGYEQLESVSEPKNRVETG